MGGGSGESTSEESSLPSSSFFKRHQHPTFETTFAVYPADVTDLRQWGLVKKFEDEGYGDCVKTPS